MDLALYDPDVGYYARAAQRSGRAGDFFTSVDVGPVFGELLEIQLAEMAGILARAREPQKPCEPRSRVFDLVEAGAGNGRLSADILRAARRRDPALYETDAPCIWSRRAPARATRSARRWATWRTGWHRRQRRYRRVRGRAGRQRTARRAAGASGRHARGGFARCTWMSPAAAGDARGSAVDAALAAISTASASCSSPGGAPRSTSARSTGFAMSPAVCAAGS